MYGDLVTRLAAAEAALGVQERAARDAQQLAHVWAQRTAVLQATVDDARRALFKVLPRVPVRASSCPPEHFDLWPVWALQAGRVLVCHPPGHLGTPRCFTRGRRAWVMPLPRKDFHLYITLGDGRCAAAQVRALHATPEPPTMEWP